MLHPALGLAVAYVAGSIPTAYLAGRLLKGIDLRTVGSGNLGATNVYRSLGFWPAFGVFIADAAKGALPVALLPSALDVSTPEARLWWAIAFGVAAIAGHAKPVFLLWKGGGKGVATAAGIFCALTPVPFAVAFAAFGVVTAASGYVSLGSLVGGVVLCAAVALFDGAGPTLWMSLAVTVFVFWAHRANIGRLLAGTESSIRKARTPGGTP